RAANSDYERLFRQRIGAPLKLKSTMMTIDAASQPRVAQGYEESRGKLAPAKPWTFRYSSVLAGAGGLRSTARDLTRFLPANVGPFEAPLLPTLADAQSERASGSSADADVGLGWHRRTLGDRIVVWHNGGTGGFHSYIAFDPVARNGVVVLSNSTGDIDDLG